MDDASDLTLDAYLDEWFALQRTRIEPSTWQTYRDMARSYLRPHLGDLTLGELTVRRLDLLYAHLLTGGGRGGRPLSRRTVVYAHAILHKALEDAVNADRRDGDHEDAASICSILMHHLS